MTFLSLRPYVRCLPECTYLRVNVCKCACMYLGTYVGVLVSMRVHVCVRECRVFSPANASCWW